MKSWIFITTLADDLLVFLDLLDNSLTRIRRWFGDNCQGRLADTVSGLKLKRVPSSFWINGAEMMGADDSIPINVRIIASHGVRIGVGFFFFRQWLAIIIILVFNLTHSIKISFRSLNSTNDENPLSLNWTTN